MEKGLYSSAYEHDACGVGMVVNIHGNKSHELVDNALKVLENMRHRGAEGADNKTGDGAGIMHHWDVMISERKMTAGILFVSKFCISSISSISSSSSCSSSLSPALQVFVLHNRQ